MRLVILESPYAGNVFANKDYLERCIADCINRGESPYASHKMLTDALDDHNPIMRHRGIEAGFEWWRVAEEIVFYTDLGWSLGMTDALRRARKLGRNISIRALDGPPIYRTPETN